MTKPYDKIPALWFDKKGYGPSELALQLHPFEATMDGGVPASLGLRIRAADPFKIEDPPTVITPMVWDATLVDSGFLLAREQIETMHRQMGEWLAANPPEKKP